MCDGVSQVALVIKNWPANTGDPRDAGLIPASSLPKGALMQGRVTHSSILAWKILWTEEPGRYGPWDGNESDMTEKLLTQKML